MAGVIRSNVLMELIAIDDTNDPDWAPELNSVEVLTLTLNLINHLRPGTLKPARHAIAKGWGFRVTVSR